MMNETCAADDDSFIAVAGPAAFLRKLRKSNRRRVRLDPASKFDQAWIVAAHADSLWDDNLLRRRRLLAVAVSDLEQHDVGAGHRIRVALNRVRNIFKVSVTVIVLVVDDRGASARLAG